MCRRLTHVKAQIDFIAQQRTNTTKYYALSQGSQSDKYGLRPISDMDVSNWEVSHPALFTLIASVLMERFGEAL